MTAATLAHRHDGDHLGAAVTVAGSARVAGDAISMPAAFGALVQAELEIMMLAGPVIAAEGSWTFLTRPANTPTPTVPTDLLAAGFRIVPTGRRVPVPTSTGPAAWVTGPDREPAIWSTVLGASRRVAARVRRLGA